MSPMRWQLMWGEMTHNNNNKGKECNISRWYDRKLCEVSAVIGEGTMQHVRVDVQGAGGSEMVTTNVANIVAQPNGGAVEFGWKGWEAQMRESAESKGEHALWDRLVKEMDRRVEAEWRKKGVQMNGRAKGVVQWSNSQRQRMGKEAWRKAATEEVQNSVCRMGAVSVATPVGVAKVYEGRRRLSRGTDVKGTSATLSGQSTRAVASR